MFSRLSIYPYKFGSESARLLAMALTSLVGSVVRRVRPNGNYSPKGTSRVVGWGCYSEPAWSKPTQFLNRPSQVAVARNKITAFQKLQGKVPIPEWTLEKTVARQWWGKGERVLCRKSLTGCGGAGIVISKVEEQSIVDAPLYVKYKSKQKEFRVHVFQGKVIDVSEKRKSLTHGLVLNQYIRNHENGWIFCRDAISEPLDLRPVSVAAVSVLGLDFGAVDVIWNKAEHKCYVLEVNTAPGIEGQTIIAYAKEIYDWCYHS